MVSSQPCKLLASDNNIDMTPKNSNVHKDYLIVNSSMEGDVSMA